jgi:hypothetical protein
MFLQTQKYSNCCKASENPHIKFEENLEDRKKVVEGDKLWFAHTDTHERKPRN